jgi:hypothetical protein
VLQQRIFQEHDLSLAACPTWKDDEGAALHIAPSNTVVQGDVGDCWLIASMVSVLPCPMPPCPHSSLFPHRPTPK